MTISHEYPANLEAQIEETRDRLTAAIGAIQEKLNPRRLKLLALDAVRAVVLRNIGTLLRQARRYPIPALMIGAGVAWVVLKRRARDSAD